MVAQPDNANYGSADWLKNASPDDLVTQGKAIFSKLGTMDQHTQDRFVQEIKGDPAAARLFEKIGSVTT